MSIETSTSQEAGGFIIKHYPGISNTAACRKKRFPSCFSSFFIIEKCFFSIVNSFCQKESLLTHYWLTSKQSMLYHVSLCQDMHFLLAFP